jgi:predicted O-linked N-acetylglucosamine transferase (SPINDLY family)
MEPLTTAAIAIGSVVATKALEKTGEKVGEALWDKTGEFIVKLRKQSPQIVAAIEKAPDQPLDYGKAVLEVEAAAKANPEVAQAVQELATAAETNPPSNLAELLREIKAAVEKSQQLYPSTFIQNIEKAINAAQNQTIDQRGSTFNF